RIKMTGQITNHLWHSTLFALAAGLLTFLFRGDRAPGRYLVWFIASVKVLIPFSLLISFRSQFHCAPSQRPPSAETLVFTIEQIAQPFPLASRLVPTRPAPIDRSVFILCVWAAGCLVLVVLRTRQWLTILAAVRESRLMRILQSVEVRSTS